MSTCETCKFWSHDEKAGVLDPVPAPFGRCTSPHWDDNDVTNVEDAVKSQCLVVPMVSEWLQCMITREDFGCIKHERITC